MSWDFCSLRSYRLLLLGAGALLGASFVQARINVVTLPERDTVQLTIYNSVDLTLVKETRHLTFRPGMNKLEFSWANTLIDPTSVEFRAVTHAAAVEVLDASFPPRVANTLEWRINSEFAGEVVCEIRYFTSGISWSADYVAEAAKNESALSLAGSVRVNNQSGEDYENAETRLVVGTVRLVEEIARLAALRGEVRQSGDRRSLREDSSLKRDAEKEFKKSVSDFDGNLAMDAGVLGGGLNYRARLKEVTKESLSEYFLYTIEGRDTISHGWAKRLPSFRAEDVPVTSLYKYERETWGDRVMRFYRFTNSEPAHLGRESLPDGAVHAFRLATEDRLYAYLGRTTVKYIPINEQVDLELGGDQEVMVRPTMTNWVKTDLAFDGNGNITGWTEQHAWLVEVQNSKDIPIVVDVRRNFSGDWTLETAAAYEKVDATKVKFPLPLAPRAQTSLAYTVTFRHGTNVKK